MADAEEAAAEVEPASEAEYSPTPARSPLRTSLSSTIRLSVERAAPEVDVQAKPAEAPAGVSGSTRAQALPQMPTVTETAVMV